MNDNHHHEAILSMRRWTNLGKKRKDGQNRAHKWHMRMCPYSTSSRIPRVFPSLIFFFSFRAGLQWTGIVPYKKTSGKEREIEHHIFSDF